MREVNTLYNVMNTTSHQITEIINGVPVQPPAHARRKVPEPIIVEARIRIPVLRAEAEGIDVAVASGRARQISERIILVVGFYRAGAPVEYLADVPVGIVKEHIFAGFAPRDFIHREKAADTPGASARTPVSRQPECLFRDVHPPR